MMKNQISKIEKDIWKAIDESIDEQKQKQKYLKIFQNNSKLEASYNQFLDTSKNFQTSIHQSTFQIYQKQEQSDWQQKALVKSQASKIDPTQIFQGIEIQIDQHSKELSIIQINLQIEDQIIKFQIGQTSQFNLSNFSSFNQNHSMIRQNHENKEFQFSQLLEKIEDNMGKKLKQSSIIKILNQIQTATNLFQNKLNNKLKQSEASTGVAYSQARQSQAYKQNHQYDTVLNKKPYSKIKNSYNSKQNKNLSSSCLNNSIKYPEFDDNNKYSKLFKQKKIPLLNASTNAQITCKREINNLKELKIIKKNNIKNAFSMNYENLKNVQHYCILNKLYGKDKDKIMKAVQLGKSTVFLD